MRSRRSKLEAWAVSPSGLSICRVALIHVIRLDTGTVAILRTHRKAQNEERLLVGPGFVDHGLVLCRPDGGPYHPDRFSLEFKRNQGYFNRQHSDETLPEPTLHGLRHTWATLALRAGIDIKIVSERLNHSFTHITREIYTHVTRRCRGDAAERLLLDCFSALVSPCLAGLTQGR